MDSASTGKELPKGRLMSLDAFRGLTIAGWLSPLRHTFFSKCEAAGSSPPPSFEWLPRLRRVVRHALAGADLDPLFAPGLHQDLVS